jgi:DNA-binding response OmpR family regulator
MLNDLVLVVDDEANIRETIAFILEMEGYDVILASDGVEALSQLRKHKPKFMILDVMMPKKNGYEVAKEIRKEKEFDDLYILILTAKGQSVDENDAINSGANSYMTKPFDDDKILKLISENF